MNSPEPAARRASSSSPARRIAAAVMLSVLVFAVLWIMVFSMVTSLLDRRRLLRRDRCSKLGVGPGRHAARCDRFRRLRRAGGDRGDLRGDSSACSDFRSAVPWHPLLKRCGSDSTCQTTLSSSGLTGRSSTPRPINSAIDVSGILDHPPSQVMTVGYASAFSRRNAPELCVTSALIRNKGRRESRVHAAPAVSCAKCAEETHTSIQVQRRHPGFPCAMGYGLLRALPGERLFCHRRSTR